MKSSKKLMAFALTLLLALPVLADSTKSPTAQEKLENEIYSLLQQGKYDKVKKVLESIPLCPESEKISESEVPSRCTFAKFNSDPYKMEDAKQTNVTIRVTLPDHPGYTKPVTLSSVKPVQALKNSLAKEYTDRFGKDIKEYNESGYLQFPEPYKGSWLEEFIPSFLVQKIWAINQDYGYNARALYNDVKWHEAQGIAYDDAAKIQYARVTNDREFLYNPLYSPITPSRVDVFLKECRYIYSALNRQVTDKNFIKKYKQRMFHDMFTKNDLTFDNPEKNTSERFYKQPTAAVDYYSPIFVFFSADLGWEVIAVDMPANLLEEMRANIAKYVPYIITNQKDYIMDFLVYSGKEHYQDTDVWGNTVYRDYKPDTLSSDFRKKAKKYGLWNDEAQKNYENLKNNKLSQGFREAMNTLGEPPKYTFPK